jgi:hypothetical protein
MSYVGEHFLRAFGKPDPAAPNGIRFRDAFEAELWKTIQADFGAGWYLDGFLFLFAEGVERLKACLKAWDFLVPPNRDRIVLGRNAHGAILVLHDANDAEKRSVHVLDPFRVLYWTHSDVTLTNLIGTFLPERLIPNFVDDSLYAQWRAGNETRLRDDEILAPRKPLGLGGKFDLDNFQREKIVSYYKTTAPIYRKAFAKMGRAAPSKRRRRK